MEITAIFRQKDKIVELYKDNVLIHTEVLQSLEDDWFGININDKEVDFNFWKDDKSYILTLYPNVTQDKEGFWHTDTDVFEQIPLTITE